MSAPRIMRRTLPSQGLWLGANGLRAGWRLLIFLAVLISCLLGFREVVVHIPTLTRMVQPLREGRLVVSAALVYGETFIYSVPNSGFPSYGHLLNSTLHRPQWLTGGSVGPEPAR